MEKGKIKNVVKSTKWLIFWISMALIFNIGVFILAGPDKGSEFLAGYLIEFSLSIDNVFVFLMIFSSFHIPEHAQHRVLSWGIASAIVLRFFFIFFGVAVVNKFEWVLWVFGVILIISAAKMFKGHESNKDPHDSKVMKVMNKFLPMTKNFVDEKFMVIENGKRMLTPLFGVLILIECSDIMFAIDSVPAVLSVSRDLFIVYTSNIFAILGLRQLYFVVEHMHTRFLYVKYGVAVILGFTGLKMLGLAFNFHIDTNLSIFIIAGILILSVVISMLVTKKKGNVIDEKQKELNSKIEAAAEIDEKANSKD